MSSHGEIKNLIELLAKIYKKKIFQEQSFEEYGRAI